MSLEFIEQMEFWKVLESGLKERMDNDPSTMKVDDGLISRIQNLLIWAPNPLLCPLKPLLSQDPVVYQQEGLDGCADPPSSGGGRRRRGGVKGGRVSFIT